MTVYYTRTLSIKMLKNIILDYEKDGEVIDSDALLAYTGSKDFSALTSLEAIADTKEMTLSFLGDLFPRLQKLRLNNSRIYSIRDISTSLVNLRFLSLAHCGISSLDGISTLSSQLEELYLAFNQLTEVTELMSLDKLTVLDLEENQIQKIDDVGILACCSSLKALTLQGNPATETETYRIDVAKLIPQLVYLDEKRLRPKKTSQIKIVPVDAPKCVLDENIITEQMADSIRERPPSSRAYGSSAFGLLRRDQGQKVPTKKIFMPKIARPVSACKKSRSEILCE